MDQWFVWTLGFLAYATYLSIFTPVHVYPFGILFGTFLGALDDHLLKFVVTFQYLINLYLLLLPDSCLYCTNYWSSDHSCNFCACHFLNVSLFYNMIGLLFGACLLVSSVALWYLIKFYLVPLPFSDLVVLWSAVETWQTSCGVDWSYQSINWTDWHGLGRRVRSTVDRSGWLAVDLCSGFGSPSMLSIDILSCSFGILLFGSSSRCYGLFYSFTIISFLQMTYQATEPFWLRFHYKPPFNCILSSGHCGSHSNLHYSATNFILILFLIHLKYC